MHPIPRVIACLLLCTAASQAQTGTWYHPDSDPGQGMMNLVPFGSGTPAWRDQRCQILVPAAALPGQPALITGISFAPAGSGTYSYRALAIRIGHLPGGVLQADFQANRSGPWASLINRTDWSMTVQANRWHLVPAQHGPIPYNGQDALVVDIIAIGSHLDPKAGFHSGSGSRCFSILPAVGCSTRLLPGGCPGSATGIPAFAIAPLPLVGGGLCPFGLDQAPPASGAVLAIGLTTPLWKGIPLPLDLTWLGSPGCTLVAPLQLTLPVRTDQQGRATVELPMMEGGLLTGTSLTAQWLILDPAANQLGLILSEGLQLELGRVSDPGPILDPGGALKIAIHCR